MFLLRLLILLPIDETRGGGFIMQKEKEEAAHSIQTFHAFVSPSGRLLATIPSNVNNLLLLLLL